ncbi:peroxisome assembly protein 26 isoform X3 [Amia ocellicauda]|uniref:peroxisome assembly protein 26 isoform X3 n=1 Tax=Amia ocellicauda TaxID=2972642 RepID=UPI0034647221
MRSSSSTSLAQARSLGSVRLGSSPLLFQGSAQALSLLDMAVEHLMVLRDFKGGLESCEKGLDSLSSLPEHEDTTSILLYTKVDEPGMILEAGGDWLRTSVNQSLPGYGAVAELYLLHILVPLGWLHEAQVLAGSYTTFTEEQRQVALEIIERKKNASSPQSLSQGQGIQQRMHIRPFSQRLTAIMRLLQRCLLMVRKGIHFLPYQKVLLAGILLYILLVRVDPAIPSAFPWISDLFQMFRQMWEAMFAPYYRVSVAC